LQNGHKPARPDLGFFPTRGRKGRFLFAFDTAVLAFMAINVSSRRYRAMYIAIPGIAAVALLFSSIYLSAAACFPVFLAVASLFYFREIARRTETNSSMNFISRRNQLDAGRSGQVWRNAQILTRKIDAVKTAFILSAVFDLTHDRVF